MSDLDGRVARLETRAGLRSTAGWPPWPMGDWQTWHARMADLERRLEAGEIGQDEHDAAQREARAVYEAELDAYGERLAPPERERLVEIRAKQRQRLGGMTWLEN